MKFKKEVLNFAGLYIAQFTYDATRPYLIFIHGGPGYNCGLVEYLIEL